MGTSGVMITRLLDSLEKEGKRILAECESEHDYVHRTHNLYDSYGYGVYYKGKLERKGFLTPSPTATEPNEWYGVAVSGRDRIEEFLKSEFEPSRGVDLVIAAAMPYAYVLENASGGQHRKYRVISMSYNKLVELQKQMKGSVVNIISSSSLKANG